MSIPSEDRSRRPALPGWATYLAGGGLALAGYAVLSRHFEPAPTIAALVLYFGIGLSSPVAILIGARRHTGPRPRPWSILGAAQLAYFFADVTLTVESAAGTPLPFTVAKPLYLLRYVLLLGSLYLIARRGTGDHRPAVLDAAVVTVAAALPAWEFVLEHRFGSSNTLDVLSHHYQPFLDLAVLALTVRLAFGRISRTPALQLLVAGAALNLVTNTVVNLQLVAGTFAPRSGVELGWLGTSLLLGAAALHPSALRPPGPVAAARHHGGRLRPWLLGGAALSAPAVLAIEARRGAVVDMRVAAIACAVLFLLVIARIWVVLTQLRAVAVTDDLTGLAHRSVFVEQVRTALAQARRQGTHVAVLFVDVDRFKLVNDSLGHAAGDDLLVELAHRLRRCLREGDVAARHGGDEFTVLLTGLADPADAQLAAERIRATLGGPVMFGDERFEPSVSIGVTTATDETDGPEDLLRYADAALYRAKDDGRNRVTAFDLGTRETLRRQVREETELRDALAAGEIAAWFQPLVDLPTGRIVGAEALARWIHPTDGVRLPGSFFPQATQAGLRRFVSRAVRLQGHHLLESLVDDLGDDVVRSFRLAVNLDVAELGLAAVVEQVMASTEARPDLRRCLTLEVTETAIIRDLGPAAQALDLAREHGFAVALDDFGTGYSSLRLLRELPLDIIKIDRTFMPRLAAGTADCAIVETTVALARQLGLDVVAEGVETPAQARHLTNLGVIRAQGFLYSPAVPADQLTAWIRAGAPWQAEQVVSG